MALRTILKRKGIARNPLGLGLGNVGESHIFLLPDLPYVYRALEPFISREIMQLHHQKHHQNYVTYFNQALKQLNDAWDKGDTYTVVKSHRDIKFNGGGHVNRSIFWESIAPVYPPKGDLDKVIRSKFGSLDVLIEKINVEGADLSGSGWVVCSPIVSRIEQFHREWLAFYKQLKKLMVETTKNEDALLSKDSTLVLLLGIDVWEHAYYLQYKNEKLEYLKNIWNIINWKYASDVYDFLEVKTSVPWFLGNAFNIM